MEAIYLLIPLSLVLVFAIGAVFWWALADGQFEDLEGPARRILLDGEPACQCRSEAIPVDADAPHEEAAAGVTVMVFDRRLRDADNGPRHSRVT